MEPISITAVATTITTIFFTKAIEKTGENLGEFLSNKTKILEFIRKENLKREIAHISRL